MLWISSSSQYHSKSEKVSDWRQLLRDNLMPCKPGCHYQLWTRTAHQPHLLLPHLFKSLVRKLEYSSGIILALETVIGCFWLWKQHFVATVTCHNNCPKVKLNGTFTPNAFTFKVNVEARATRQALQTRRNGPSVPRSFWLHRSQNQRE